MGGDLHWANIPPRHPAMSHGPAMMTRTASGSTSASANFAAFFICPCAKAYDDKDGQRQYEWGHYGNDRTAMEQDFTDRVQDYQRIYNVGIRQTEAPGLYKYYSTQRPVDIGTFPKPPYNKPDEIFNYDQRGSAARH